MSKAQSPADDFEATIFVCQGSTDLVWREPYDHFVDAYRQRHPDQRILLAFCEAMAPGLAELIDELAIELCDRVRIIAIDLPPDCSGDRMLTATLRAAARRWPEMQLVRIAGDTTRPSRCGSDCTEDHAA